MIAYESARAAQVLAVAGLVAVAAWFAVFAVLAAASRTRNPDVGPPTQELGGKEPAAIVDLITHGWRVSENAPAATLLDLAARRALRLDWIAEDQFIVRARTEPPDLLPYEEMVFQHVRGLMHDDRAVPSAALTVGDGAAAARWWKKFRQAVLADAFARGLAREAVESGGVGHARRHGDSRVLVVRRRGHRRPEQQPAPTARRTPATTATRSRPASSWRSSSARCCWPFRASSAANARPRAGWPRPGVGSRCAATSPTTRRSATRRRRQ